MTWFDYKVFRNRLYNQVSDLALKSNAQTAAAQFGAPSVIKFFQKGANPLIYAPMHKYGQIQHYIDTVICL